ncbi:MAG: hypothetical protein ACXVA6_21785 [Isosphaeraceae bacterium]
MSGTTAALVGALIGAVTALASGVLAGYFALRSERMRHREAGKAAHVGSVREHTAAFFAELFAIHFAANWVAWFAEYDPGALDHEMAEFYDTETYRAVPKLLGSTAMVAALNTGVYEQLKPLIIEVYKLWERVMHGLHQLDRSPDEAIAELRGCLPDAMKLEFQLIPELARIMELAGPPDASGSREERKGSSRAGSPA